MENATKDNNELNSLENPDTVVETSSVNSSDATSNTGTPDPQNKPKRKKSIGKRLQELIFHVNIYLLLFILIVILSFGIVFVGIQRNKGSETPLTITTQPLSEELLDQISGSDTKIGDPKQTLSIESNSIFTGQVLVRGGLEVAGTLRVGGALSLPGITVSGMSNFDEIQANSLAIAGDTNVQGQLTVQQNLTVSGGGTFGGPISAPTIIVQDLQINSDLRINRHIDAGGTTPSRNNGNALGSGGTSSVSGTDTAGRVNINVGGGGIPATGCFVTVNFANAFNGTPHIVITPVGAGAANLNYYITANTGSFSICATNANVAAGRSFAFNYIAID